MNYFEEKSPNETISYRDNLDHFENALLRLSGMNRVSFKKWLSLSEVCSGTLLEKLSKGFSCMHPSVNSLSNFVIIDPGPYGEIGKFWHQLDNDYSIIKSNDGAIAWLAKKENNHLIYETNPSVYEEEYFEGDPVLSGGYGQYTEQSSWRIDKAFRQINDIKTITGLIFGNALDIGSGYGYFRHALEQNGFTHSGIEISNHARYMASRLYKYDTFSGTLNSHYEKLNCHYDLITLWDVIEHVSDPISLLKEAYWCLRPGGFLVVKTPNIDCPEAEMFGSLFYSFRREHLVYFSNNSLQSYAKQAGFSIHYASSISHFLTGFVGEKQAMTWAKSLRGSDLIIYLKKNKEKK